jgi:hypothetical protein
MNTSRRSFIQKTAIVLAGSSVFSKQLFAAAPKTSQVFNCIPFVMK